MYAAQFAPPSSDWYTPWSVATYNVPGCDGASAIALVTIDANPVDDALHDAPASVLFKTPPATPESAQIHGGYVPSAESGALHALERQHVMAALRGLPHRQREVLVLRYYADMSEAQIADAMGISPGAVKSHASRGIAALRESMESCS